MNRNWVISHPCLKDLPWFPSGFGVKTRILTEINKSYQSIKTQPTHDILKGSFPVTIQTQVKAPINIENMGSESSLLRFASYFCHFYLCELGQLTTLGLFSLNGDSKGTYPRGVAIRSKRTHIKHLGEYV